MTHTLLEALEVRMLLATMPLSFAQQVIDANVAGDVKFAGDLSGDGKADLVVGGSRTEGLNWYRYPEWTKIRIATPTDEFTTDGKLGDIDGDGDLDIIVPDGRDGNNIVWFENPRPEGDPMVGAAWVRHEIGASGGYSHDVQVADFDRDGRLDVATRNSSQAMIFFNNGGTWTQVVLPAGDVGTEGLGAGNLNSDSCPDLIVAGGWLRNPGPGRARIAALWTRFAFGQVNCSFKAVVEDLTGDGVNEIITCCPESTGDLAWWSVTGGDPTQAWTKHLIAASVTGCHTLQAGDVDHDGDVDILSGQMHTTVQREVAVWRNSGQGASWTKVLLATTGIHNGVLADIGGDGYLDVFGSNYMTSPPAYLWVNNSVRGDFNGDAKVTTADIDLLADNFGGDVFYDLTGDGLANSSDMDELLHGVLHTNYGDANLDGMVGFTDFQALLDHWQRPGDWATADFSGDGMVEFSDFQLLLDNWNPTGAASVPELHQMIAAATVAANTPASKAETAAFEENASVAVTAGSTDDGATTLPGRDSLFQSRRWSPFASHSVFRPTRR